ncbi:MAG: ornithine carbamoyltransferase [Rhodospirillales bacterium]|nr:ornithine carbamoyltransferase [Rhodospirillales bacterium]
MTQPKHFLDIDRLDSNTLQGILDLGHDLKKSRKSGSTGKPLDGKTLVMIFEKPSTRTRVSFQVGMQELGGHTVILTDDQSQLGRGETVADTARVLSRYADAIMIRTDDPSKLIELEEYASIPVINGLTDSSHPCQIMADVMTFEEHRGSIKDRTVAWTGDGNNVVTSWVHAAARFGFEMRIATPAELKPSDQLIGWADDQGAKVVLTEDPAEAVNGADLVVTDTWVSMGDKDAGTRHNMLSPYRVDDALMSKAADEALFMHCLPAHRGDEVTDSVMDGPKSVVWDEAENRLHVQKAILSWCLS